MALGRGEMECPDEMWNAAQRGVDEAKLSRLASTRAYLHAHIYRPETLYAQWGEVLEVWGGLDWSKAVAAADNVRKCAELHGPLTELLAGDADSGAPSRLAQLQGARARWLAHIEDDVLLQARFLADDDECFRGDGGRLRV